MVKEDIINLVVRQTNYSREEAIKKLEQWNNNHLNVIKEYLNPNFNKKKETKKISTNQKIIKGIRNYMDDVAIQYEKRKKMKEELKLQMEIEEEGKKQEELYKKEVENNKKIKENENLENLKQRKEEEENENKTDGVTFSEI